MKIAYVAQVDAGVESGVVKKVAAQMREWCAQGAEVRLFVMNRHARLWEGWSGLDVRVYAYGGALERFRASARLAAEVGAWGADVVYFRQGVCYPAFRRLAERRPLVVEINTDDDRESRLRMGRAAYLYHRVTRDALMRRAAAIVSVNASVGRRLQARYGHPLLVMGNSIRLADHPPLPPARGAAPRLLFLGTPGHPWHGVDKILTLAAAFPGWGFDIVGMGPEGAAAPPNVVFHGYLSGDRYRDIAAGADVALGSLALHRIGMDETSSLKTREYLALGLATVLAHDDPDFSGPAPFLLRLRNTPDNVTAERGRIEAFVRRWHGRRVEPQAAAHLDVGVKERARLDFLRGTARGRP